MATSSRRTAPAVLLMLLPLLLAPLVGSLRCVPPPAARLRVAAASVARRPGGLQQPLRAPPRRTAVQLSPSTALQVDFIHANRWQLIKLAAVAAVATLSAVSVPLAFSRVLSTLTAVDGFTMPELVRRLAVMVVLHTVEPCMTVLYVQQSAALIDRFVTSLRARVYATLLRREVAAFEATDASPAATATQLVVGEVDRVKTAAMQNLSRDRGLRAGLELVAGLTILYTLCWPLAVMFNVVVPITSYISSRFGKRLFAATVAENHAGLRQAARAAETIGNFKEVFSFSNQPLEEARFATVQAEASRAAAAVGRAKGVTEASNRAGVYSNIVAMFAFGGWLVLQGRIQPLKLVSFFSYCWSLNFATQGLLFTQGDVNTAAASWGKIKAFLDAGHLAPPTAASTAATAATAIDDAPATTAADATASMHVELHDVMFSYPNRADVPVLANLTLSVPAGKVTALVGPSGAGKSTVAALLSGFYEPTSGAVTVDGVLRADLPRDTYLAAVSAVRQAPALFTDTVANNIAYGAVAYRPVSRADVERAAQLANADAFIRRLPDGYDTIIGDGAGQVQLSGGQKQRVAIARALLKDARLLILDEATSALDSESEALVQDALARLISGRTTVVIAHRLSTVIAADQIAYIKDGTVAEVGTHDALMAKKGLYYSLMSTQMAGYGTLDS